MLHLPPPRKWPNRTEMMVSRYLTSLGIEHHYEPADPLYDTDGRPRLWTPDFFLCGLLFYVEVVGDSKRECYDYRQKTYEFNHMSVLFLYVDRENWRAKLHGYIRDLGNSHYKLTKKVLDKVSKP